MADRTPVIHMMAKRSKTTKTEELRGAEKREAENLYLRFLGRRATTDPNLKGVPLCFFSAGAGVGKTRSLDYEKMAIEEDLHFYDRHQILPSLGMSYDEALSLVRR